MKAQNSRHRESHMQFDNNSYQEVKQFDIRFFTEKLEPAKEKGKYICPVCEQDNLSINSKNGAYKCFGAGCSSKQIRDAVAPLPKKELRPLGKKEFIYKDRDAQPLIKVTRSDDGEGRRRFYQSHWDGMNWVKGVPAEIKGRCPIYRYAEVKESLASGQTIFLVEGEGVADALWEMGVAATTFVGGSSGYVPNKYKDDLKDAKLVLCPDRDEPGVKFMDEVFKEFNEARWLYAPPNEFYWTHLPKNGGLDVADWIRDGASVEQIMEAVSDRRLVVEALNKSLESEPGDSSTRAQSKNKQLYNVIQSQWGQDLRFNLLTKQAELKGENLPLDRIKIKVAKHFDIDCASDTARDVVLEVAHEKEYSPVKEYLDGLPQGDASKLDEIAYRYFGTDDRLSAAIIKRTLIAGVARAYAPGCKHDCITILQGEQGCGKSTFWKVLAGEELFCDDLSESGEKDTKLQLSRYWILEFSEFETAYRKKDVASLKAFLARSVDSCRPPYGSDIQDFRRPSILVGSTNREDFLTDPTGERRFWPVVVNKKKIDINLLRQERDSLWAAAIAAYRNGEQWWLTDSEDELLKELNQNFSSSDPWEEVIMGAIATLGEVTIEHILTEVVKKERSLQTKADQIRVGDILRSNAWAKGSKKRIGGKVTTPWCPGQKDRDGNRAGNMVVAASNPDTQSNAAKHEPKGVVTELATPSSPCAVGDLLLPVDNVDNFFEETSEEIEFPTPTTSTSQEEKVSEVMATPSEPKAANPGAQANQGCCQPLLPTHSDTLLSTKEEITVKELKKSCRYKEGDLVRFENNLHSNDCPTGKIIQGEVLQVGVEGGQVYLIVGVKNKTGGITKHYPWVKDINQ